MVSIVHNVFTFQCIIYLNIKLSYLNIFNPSSTVAIGRIGICTSDIVMGAEIIYCTRNGSQTVVRGCLATSCEIAALLVVASCGGRESQGVLRRFLTRVDVFCLCDKAALLQCSDIQVYSGNLCNYESYSSLKSLLCVSALECVEIVQEDVRVVSSGQFGEKWVCPVGPIAEQQSPGGMFAESGRVR